MAATTLVWTNEISILETTVDGAFQSQTPKMGILACPVLQIKCLGNDLGPEFQALLDESIATLPAQVVSAPFCLRLARRTTAILVGDSLQIISDGTNVLSIPATEDFKYFLRLTKTWAVVMLPREGDARYTTVPLNGSDHEDALNAVFKGPRTDSNLANRRGWEVFVAQHRDAVDIVYILPEEDLRHTFHYFSFGGEDHLPVSASRGACEWCGKAETSEEHIIPRWILKIVAATGVQAKILCVNCNNGLGGLLEDPVSRLYKSSTMLEQCNSEIVSRWAAKTAYVLASLGSCELPDSLKRYAEAGTVFSELAVDVREFQDDVIPGWRYSTANFDPFRRGHFLCSFAFGRIVFTVSVKGSGEAPMKQPPEMTRLAPNYRPHWLQEHIGAALDNDLEIFNWALRKQFGSSEMTYSNAAVTKSPDFHQKIKQETRRG